LFGLPPVSAVTPLRVDHFAQELVLHPDQAQVAYVLRGIRDGFQVGFRSHHKLKQAKKNKESAINNPQVIDSYLNNEVQLGRVAGPYVAPPLAHLQVSSFGVIPKRGQPGKWRLIVDLSSPRGLSVNDGIEREDFTNTLRVDQIVKMVSNLGRGAMLAKFDVEAAYRNIPVHPSDRYLLGMKWRNNYFVDLALPFGLRSAPFIFNSVASMVEWILVNNYQVSNLVHYLDDFIMAGPPGSNTCAINFNKSLQVCQDLGLPLHPDKCVGPCTTMVVLGIELDSINQIARLPADKLLNLQQLITLWRARRWCNKRQLESLIGYLHHAAKVVWPGRTFIRRMIDLLCCFRKPEHPIRLNCEFRRDLEWWHQFLNAWHGVSFWLYPVIPVIRDLEVVSDASGTIGYGAFFDQEWFNGVWVDTQTTQSIAYKELFPIILAAHIWGPRWERLHILFRSDNEAVVSILNHRTSKVPILMRLMRSLLLAAARFNFSFSSQHIPGVHNSIADALSRFNWQEFRRVAPSAHQFPTPIPHQLIAELTSPY